MAEKKNMRISFLILLFPCVVLAAPVRPKVGVPAGPVKFELKFTENFNGSKLNEKLWGRIGAGNSDWNRNMSERSDLVKVNSGFATLLGVANKDKTSDSRDFLTGGISTRGKFNILYGKIEVRAKLQAARGAWPAIWLMPEDGSAGWPLCGEIDIIERLNYDPFVYHTIHSAFGEANKGKPAISGKGKIKPDAWNIYALEWYTDKLVWKVNGSVTHTYPKLADDASKWPWDKPFYLMIDMQLGGTWVGAVDESTLPCAMQIDWVKFYQMKQGTKVISEFSRPRR